MEKLIINAPAKINLGLHIIEKLETGYHNIETIFYPLNLHDKLTLSKSNHFEFRCNEKSLLTDTVNLVIRAKERIETHCKKKIEVKVQLEKRIPIGAGLGGGSTDAAATLKGINELYGLGLSDKILLELALSLGSDVPFFINPEVSLATSRGEVLKPIHLKIQYPILLVNPGIHISTKWAYENISPHKPQISLSEITNFDFDKPESLSKILVNDFEPIVFAKYPELKKIKEELYESGALIALMTGSGATIFGIFKDLSSAKNTEKIFDKSYFTFIHSG